MRKRDRDKRDRDRALWSHLHEYDEMNVDDEPLQKMTAKTGLPST